MTTHSSAGVYTTEDDRSQVPVGVATSIGALVGEAKQGPVGVPTLITDTAGYEQTFGRPDPSMGFLPYAALPFLNESQRLYVVRVAPGATWGGFVVSRSSNLNRATAWSQGVDNPSLYNFDPQDLFIITGANQGRWTEGVRCVIYPNTVGLDYTFYVDVYVPNKGQSVERHLVHLDYMVNGFNVQINIEEYINKRSKYIQVVQNRNNAEFRATPRGPLINTLVQGVVSGGLDGARATAGQIIQGWDLYTDPEQLSVNLLINGGYADPNIQSAMDQICRQRQDCMSILDMPSDLQNIQDAIDYRRNILNLDSSYSAIYATDYWITDEYNDHDMFVPPSGYVAAAYARTDTEYETWFAPAGMNRGRLDVRGVRIDHNQGARDALTDNQINSTRVVPGAGIKIWGADTMQSMTSALSNVSVRRLMLFLEKSLSEVALYSVFNPNDTRLRAKLEDQCNLFLKPIKNGRGLYDFGVQCNDNNNPPEVVAAGDVILSIYVDPMLPAKRIFFKATVNKTGATVTGL